MPDENGTLNNTDAGAGESSVPEHHSEDLVETVDLQSPDASPEGALKPEETGADGKADEAAKAGEKIKPEEKDKDTGRFDQNPRFKELETQRDTNFERAVKAESKAEALEVRIAALEKGPGTTKETPATDYKDISQMSNEDLLDWQESDPKGYAANILQQAKAQLREELGSSGFTPDKLKEAVQEVIDGQSRENRINQTYSKFAEAHPDFNGLWDSGKLKTFMDTNPGHNAISAYHEISGEASVQTRIDEAVKKATDKTIAEFRAKRGAAVLGDGPSGSATVNEISPELKDPKKFGGATNVLTRRLQSFRQRMGAG